MAARLARPRRSLTRDRHGRPHGQRGTTLRAPVVVQCPSERSRPRRRPRTAPAGNPRLTRFLATVLEEMQRLYYFGLTGPYADHPAHESGHRMLVEALVSGDPDRAEEVARE
ncbi:MAG: FCD domain-containing protein, partial [Propionibacteriales bacterium]|nr:FCD domain-containing protein [Propionibacteriales bacterium]